MSADMTQAWTLEALIEALGDELVTVTGQTQQTVGPVLTDTRRLTPGCVFVALKGAQFDGHDYAMQAAEQGAGVLVLERSVGAACPELIVKDTAEAYGALARAWRLRHNAPVICVVGANGKTTTTQMIASILRAAYGDERIVATQKNYNNAVGVPMTLLGFHGAMQAAVIEAGINHPGEMAQLAGWIRPTVVVITNAQREHQEFLDGVEGSARENGTAIVSLEHDGVAVLPKTDGCIAIWQHLARARGCRVMTYAAEAAAQVSATRCADGVRLVGPFGEATVALHLAGHHAVHDAAAAATATLAAGVPMEAVCRGLDAFRPVAGRGVVHRLRSGAVLIDEAYNANPDSMRAAIDVLAGMPEPRVLVAGDMGEVGAQGPAFHREIGRYARDKGIDRLLTVGELMREAQVEFGANAEHYASLEALTQAVTQRAAAGGTLLVKASNFMKLSGVVRSIVEIDAASNQDN